MTDKTPQTSGYFKKMTPRPIKLIACNCDGDWHVSIPDPDFKGQYLTVELDISEILKHYKIKEQL